jgi:hypothetical protein
VLVIPGEVEESLDTMSDARKTLEEHAGMWGEPQFMSDERKTLEEHTQTTDFGRLRHSASYCTGDGYFVDLTT